MVQQLRQPHKIDTSLHTLSYLKYYKQLENPNIFPVVDKNWAVVFTERVKIQNESRLEQVFWRVNGTGVDWRQINGG